jgi:D-alanyl-D-alanine carboxypeptidase
MKTGTLRGVYSLGGYLKGERPLCFVIILNQKKNYRKKILSLIQDEYQERGTSLLKTRKAH